jgi:Domain of unknown function (DUF4470)
VTVNDLEPLLSARNLLLLLAISGVRNQDLAADIALHLWYSAFIPKEYNDRITAFSKAAMSTISNGRLDWEDGGKLRIICDLTQPFVDALKTYLTQTPDADNASQEYVKVMWVNL